VKEKNKFQGFEEADRPTVGLALIFDISAFTNFFNKPDLQLYITKYINHIVECVEITIYGGVDYWTNTPEELAPLDIKPSLRKFLGDGMLYIWEDDENKISKDSNLKVELINRLWNLQNWFYRVNERLYDDVPIGDLPNTLKFGIAQGTIYRLSENDGNQDFIGPCINLASRLVKYCPNINFICSARLDLNKETLEEEGFFKIIAKELRSFENEIVFIDKSDYSNLSPEDKERLFKEIKKVSTLK
jgi:class 3 adenylate cyclase